MSLLSIISDFVNIYCFLFFKDLLIGSSIFLLEDVRETCVNYLKEMIDPDNCINMKDFANSLGLNDLYSLCLDYIMSNFR